MTPLFASAQLQGQQLITMATVTSNTPGANAFPYSLQPQPPSHPKTTGGKRGPSAPIAIPSWAKGEDDADEDSDHSITDHTPPSHTGRLVNLDTSFSSSPSSTTANPSTRGATVVYVSNQVSSPRGLSTTKKFSSGSSSPRTLFNNNNSVTLNLNHSVSSVASAPASSAPTTTPILIIHTSNSSKANLGESASSNHSSSSSSSNTHSNSSLPLPGSSLLASTNAIPATGSGLTTTHPPAPWVSSQSSGTLATNISNLAGASAKHGNLATPPSSLSKVPKLVDNPIQTKDSTSGFSLKGQKGLDHHLTAASSLASADSSSLNQTHQLTTTQLSGQAQTATKTGSYSSNALVVGIPDNIVAPKSDSSGQSTLLLSPAEASSEGDAPVSSPTSSSSNSCFAYELDHDYENVASPCSSTASGPTYVRQPGFRHHAHEVTLPAGSSTSAAASSSSSSSAAAAAVSHGNATLFSASLSPSGNGTNAFRLKQKKKCSAMLVNFREGFKKREATPPKLKPKRGTSLCENIYIYLPAPNGERYLASLLVLRYCCSFAAGRCIELLLLMLSEIRRKGCSSLMGSLYLLGK